MRSQLAPGTHSLLLGDQKTRSTCEDVRWTHHLLFLLYLEGPPREKNHKSQVHVFRCQGGWGESPPAPSKHDAPHPPAQWTFSQILTSLSQIFLNERFGSLKTMFRDRLSRCGTKPHISRDPDVLEPFLSARGGFEGATAVNPETSEASKPAFWQGKKKRHLPAVEGRKQTRLGEMTRGTCYQTSCQHSLQAKPLCRTGIGVSQANPSRSWLLPACYYFGSSSGPFTYSVFTSWAPARCQAKGVGWVKAEMPGVSGSKRHERSGARGTAGRLPIRAREAGLGGATGSQRLQGKACRIKGNWPGGSSGSLETAHHVCRRGSTCAF